MLHRVSWKRGHSELVAPQVESNDGVCWCEQRGIRLHEVTERRIDYLTGLFNDLGFTDGEARQRGLMAYSFYLGHSQLGHAVPSVLPSPEEFPGYLEATMVTLLRRDQ